MSSDHYEEKYTKPDLRRKIKDELQQSGKGGRKGQWSARKSQMLVQEYEKRGGGYKNAVANCDEASSLKEWTEQEWQTREGSAYADSGGGMKRYLPKKAWDLLSDDEKRRAEQKKRQGDRAGEQFVANTIEAKAARAFVDHGDARELREEQLKRLTKKELMQIARDADLPHRSKMAKNQLARTLRKHFRAEAKSGSKS